MRGPWNWGSERPAARRAAMVASVQAHTDGTQPLRHVMAAGRGPRPGVEVLGVALAEFVGPASFGGLNPAIAGLWGGLLALIIFGAIEMLRQRFVIAVTDTQVVVFRSSHLHPLRASAMKEAVDLAGGIDLGEGSNSRLTIATTRYWLVGSDLDEARKASRQTGPATV